MSFAKENKMMSTAAEAPHVALAPRCVTKGRN